VKELLMRLNGTITIESIASTNTTFKISLPKTQLMTPTKIHHLEKS
jgi:chemotaxis protein histidine kinase CheA